jgi:hypothetical protein
VFGLLISREANASAYRHARARASSIRRRCIGARYTHSTSFRSFGRWSRIEAASRKGRGSAPLRVRYRRASRADPAWQAHQQGEPRAWSYRRRLPVE